jgi:hypothetical protein
LSPQPVTTHGISGWNLGPGQALYVAAVATDGTVVTATEPQTDNPLRPTATDMELAFFDPARLSFNALRVPTSTGQTTAVQPHLPVGGADVSDVVALSCNRIAFASSVPFHGWDLATEGQFPTVGLVGATPAGWALQSAWTGDQLNEESPRTCPRPALSAACSISAVGALPESGDLVTAEYFGDSSTGARSGDLVVLSSTGQVLARYPYPNVSAAGQPITVAPREVDVDPSGTAEDERFAVVFDSFGANGSSQPSAVQEFQFDGRSVSPRSAPISTPSGAPDLSVDVATYDPQGNLWITLSHVRTGSSAGAAVYSRQDRATWLEGLCAARPDWASQQWRMPCLPSQSFALPGGAIFSLTADPVTGAVLAVSSSGQLVVLVPEADGWQTSSPVDLGVNLLVDRTHSRLSLRRGAIDSTGRALWLPIGQLAPGPMGGTWPTRPTPRDQWLYRIDLVRLLGR